MEVAGLAAFARQERKLVGSVFWMLPCVRITVVNPCFGIQC
jgi:hypothetical protein